MKQKNKRTNYLNNESLLSLPLVRQATEWTTNILEM